MTQHDVNMMCCSNSSAPHWPLQGMLSSAVEAGVRSRHRCGIYSGDLTAAEAAMRAALPYSFSGAKGAASHVVTPQVQLSWGRKPCVNAHVHFQGVQDNVRGLKQHVVPMCTGFSRSGLTGLRSFKRRAHLPVPCVNSITSGSFMHLGCTAGAAGTRIATLQRPVGAAAAAAAATGRRPAGGPLSCSLYSVFLMKPQV